MGPFELDSISRRFAPSTDRGAWAESVGLISVCVAVGFVVQPEDPLFTSSGGFPWPIFVPVLMGLRYGFAQAFVIAVALHLTAFVIALVDDSAPWPIPLGYGIGLLLVSMIAGEFRDIWAQRIEHLERSNEYRQARLEEFTRAYHVLKISHDNLEQANAGNRSSLRSALLELRRTVYRDSDLEESGAALLEMLNAYCMLQAGFVVTVTGDQRLRIGRVAAAFGGDVTTMPDVHDPVISGTLAHRHTTSVDAANPDSMRNRQPGDPLVCVPLVDTYMGVHALVVVTQMPLFAFTDRNLQLMSIIAGSMADFQAAENHSLEGLEEGELEFVVHAKRCLTNAIEYALPSSIVAITFENETAAPALIDTIAQETRGLDVLHTIQEHDRTVLLLLLPLTPRAGVDQFLIRFNGYLERQHGGSANELGVNVAHFTITESTRANDLDRFLVSFIGRDHVVTNFLTRERAA